MGFYMCIEGVDGSGKSSYLFAAANAAAKILKEEYGIANPKLVDVDSITKNMGIMYYDNNILFNCEGDPNATTLVNKNIDLIQRVNSNFKEEYSDFIIERHFDSYIDPAKNFSLSDADILLVTEPMNLDALAIRGYINQAWHNPNSNVDIKQVIESFADDRKLLFKRIVEPALAQGKIVISSRGVSSIAYQQIQHEELKGERFSYKAVLNYEGNEYVKKCLDKYSSILEIISIPRESIESYINTVASTRLEGRQKDDNSRNESNDFAMKLAVEFCNEEYTEAMFNFYGYLEGIAATWGTKAQGPEFYMNETRKIQKTLEETILSQMSPPERSANSVRLDEL